MSWLASGSSIKDVTRVTSTNGRHCETGCANEPGLQMIAGHFDRALLRLIAVRDDGYMRAMRPSLGDDEASVQTIWALTRRSR